MAKGVGRWNLRETMGEHRLHHKEHTGTYLN